MSIRRYAGLAFTSAAIVLGGYGIMILVTPTDEQIKARMTPEQRQRFDAEEQTRIQRKEKLFEHLKYNMNSDRPVWDVQWDKLKDDNVKYPPPRTNLPPPSRKREVKSKTGDDQPV